MRSDVASCQLSVHDFFGRCHLPTLLGHVCVCFCCDALLVLFHVCFIFFSLNFLRSQNRLTAFLSRCLVNYRNNELICSVYELTTSRVLITALLTTMACNCCTLSPNNIYWFLRTNQINSWKVGLQFESSKRSCRRKTTYNGTCQCHMNVTATSKEIHIYKCRR